MQLKLKGIVRLFSFLRILLKMTNSLNKSELSVDLLQHHLSLGLRKPAFCICENIDADQLRGDREMISAFVFAI